MYMCVKSKSACIAHRCGFNSGATCPGEPRSTPARKMAHQLAVIDGELVGRLARDESRATVRRAVPPGHGGRGRRHIRSRGASFRLALCVPSTKCSAGFCCGDSGPYAGDYGWNGLETNWSNNGIACS